MTATVTFTPAQEAALRRTGRELAAAFRVDYFDVVHRLRLTLTDPHSHDNVRAYAAAARWWPLDRTSPSGRQLFVCLRCGRTVAWPQRHCPDGCE